MRTANEAPGTATLASPHSRLAWLPARQHCLEGSGPLRPWVLCAGPSSMSLWGAMCSGGNSLEYIGSY